MELIQKHSAVAASETQSIVSIDESASGAGELVKTVMKECMDAMQGRVLKVVESFIDEVEGMLDDSGDVTLLNELDIEKVSSVYGGFKNVVKYRKVTVGDDTGMYQQNLANPSATT